jgi:hypothetical protein
MIYQVVVVVVVQVLAFSTINAVLVLVGVASYC